jgi:hypothetical protein
VLPSSAAVACDPSPSATVIIGGVGLVACDYTDARSFAERVLQFLNRMKNAVDDQEGT